MIDALRTIAFLTALATAPGVLADLAVRLVLAMRFSVFPLMDPERVPHALAIYVTQWWLTLIGIAIIAAVTHSWIHDRRNDHANGP